MRSRRRLFYFLGLPAEVPPPAGSSSASSVATAGAVLLLTGAGAATGLAGPTTAGELALEGGGSATATSFADTGPPVILPGGTMTAASDASATPAVMLSPSATATGTSTGSAAVTSTQLAAGTSTGTSSASALGDVAIGLSGSAIGVSRASAGGMAGPAFRVYVRNNDGTLDLRRAVAGGGRDLDLAGVLSAGVWRLAVTRVDQYGSESDPADVRSQLTVTVDGGTVSAAMIEPTQLAARPIEGGEIELVWHAVPSRLSGGGFAVAVEYEIAAVADLGTVLETVTAGRAGIFIVQTEGGAFADGDTVRLAVRASDGEISGARGLWVVAPAVVVDGSGPTPAPELIDEVSA